MRIEAKSAVWMSIMVLLFGVLACSLPDFGRGDDVPETAGNEQEAANLQTAIAEVGVTPMATITPFGQGESQPVGILPTDMPVETEESLSPSDEPVPPAFNQVDGAVVVYVPEGEFLMGNEAYNAKADEIPAHMVFLDAYWLYQTPVTNQQYRQCIVAEVCEGSIGRYPENDLPAVNVTWFDAMNYCEWAGGRLPTEAEWEKGARGTDGRTYPWGDMMPTCELANYKNCYGSEAIPVGLLTGNVSPYGALDMVGNVWEWVFDWYDAEYYAASPYENPTGPIMVDEEFRGQRGGSFENNPDLLSVTLRGRSGPDKADYRKGFRCVIPETP